MAPVVEQLPKEMKALVVEGKNQKYYTPKTLPIPTPGPHQALVRIAAAGFCHTDLLVMQDFPLANYPVVGSHEPAGVVVRLGEEAEKAGRITVGERVAGYLPQDPCFECPDCKLVDWKFCPHTKYGGIMADGYFAEYAIVDARLVAKVPESMTFEEAAPLTCAGVTMYGAIKRANLKAGDIIGISGLGALGHLGLQMAKAMGLKVVGIDARSVPVELVKRFKLAPDITIDASQTTVDEAKQEIRKLRPKDYFGWDGVDAMILTADPVPSHRYGLDLTRRHGLIVFVAQPPEIKFDFNDFIFRDLTVVGHLHGNEKDLQETVDLVAEHGIEVEVTKFGYDEHQAMVDSLGDEGRKGKSVLVF